MPQLTIARSITRITSSHSPPIPDLIPNALASVTEIIPPSMKTSPWAKLISSRMP